MLRSCELAWHYHGALSRSLSILQPYHLLLILFIKAVISPSTKGRATLRLDEVANALSRPAGNIQFVEPWRIAVAAIQEELERTSVLEEVAEDLVHVRLQPVEESFSCSPVVRCYRGLIAMRHSIKRLNKQIKVCQEL